MTTASSDHRYTEIADLSDDAPSLREIRHDIHRHPELSYEETRTAALVAANLEEWGWQVTRGVGGLGVVGTLKAGTGTKSIGLRADMDALPIIEQTGKPYASETHGKMHRAATTVTRPCCSAQPAISRARGASTARCICISSRPRNMACRAARSG
jgi:hippurate hydrolase